MRINRPKDGEYRYKTKFLWFPKRFDGGWYWLETITIRQVYLYHGVLKRGWSDICLLNPPGCGLKEEFKPKKSLKERYSKQR